MKQLTETLKVNHADNEKIIFFKQNEKGDWSTFCEFYLVESTRTDGIS